MSQEHQQQHHAEHDEQYVETNPAVAAYLLYKGASLLHILPEQDFYHFNIIFERDARLEDALAEVRAGQADGFLEFSRIQSDLFKRFAGARKALTGGGR